MDDPEEEDLNDWMNLPIEETTGDNTPAYEPAEDQEYTGENASHMKGSDFDIDQDDFIFNIGDTEENTDPDFF